MANDRQSHRLDEQPIGSVAQLLHWSGQWSEGQVINVEVVRQDGKHHTVDIKVKMNS